MWGLFPTDLHLIGPLKPSDPMYLLGTDKLGRDLLTRLIYGTRVSMSIGLIGVVISLTLGVVLGGLSGFYGGWVDLVDPAPDRGRSAPCRRSRSGSGSPPRSR